MSSFFLSLVETSAGLELPHILPDLLIYLSVLTYPTTLNASGLLAAFFVSFIPELVAIQNHLIQKRRFVDTAMVNLSFS